MPFKFSEIQTEQDSGHCRNSTSGTKRKYPEIHPLVHRSHAGGISVWTCLTQRRLELAKQMLATTDLFLKELAAECGFCSSSYFSRQFKRYLRTTPQNYRIEHSMQYIRAFRFSGTPRRPART